MRIYTFTIFHYKTPSQFRGWQPLVLFSAALLLPSVVARTQTALLPNPFFVKDFQVKAKFGNHIQETVFTLIGWRLSCRVHIWKCSYTWTTRQKQEQIYLIQIRHFWIITFPGFISYLQYEKDHWFQDGRLLDKSSGGERHLQHTYHRHQEKHGSVY